MRTIADNARGGIVGAEESKELATRRMRSVAVRSDFPRRASVTGAEPSGNTVAFHLSQDLSLNLSARKRESWIWANLIIPPAAA